MKCRFGTSKSGTWEITDFRGDVNIIRFGILTMDRGNQRVVNFTFLKWGFDVWYIRRWMKG